MHLYPVLVSVHVTPPTVIFSTLGGSARFGCVISPDDGVEDVQWLANGTALDDLSQINSTAQYYVGSGFGRLTLVSLSSSFNMTRITCRALYADRDGIDSTGSTVCLLQGYI